MKCENCQGTGVEPNKEKALIYRYIDLARRLRYPLNFKEMSLYLHEFLLDAQKDGLLK